MPTPLGSFFPARNITEKRRREITSGISTGESRGAGEGPLCQQQNKSSGSNVTLFHFRGGLGPWEW